MINAEDVRKSRFALVLSDGDVKMWRCEEFPRLTRTRNHDVVCDYVDGKEIAAYDADIAARKLSE